jgi:tetratricopeptide (TPR) repeat protein
MKKLKVILFVLFAAIIFTSCNRNIVPGLKPGKAGKEFDEASYNYRYVEGVRQKLMGNLGEALTYFEQAIAINPRSDASYYQMAQIVLNNGDIVNGKRYVKKACELDPDNYWYNMILAGIYYQQKNIDSTIICYENTIKNHPEKVDLQVALANLYIENKSFDKSKSLLNKLDEKYGVNENTTVLLVRSLMAEKKYKEALSKTMQLIDQNPDNIIFNGLLAEIYRGQGENQKAHEVYNKLIQRNPDNPALQLSLCDFLLSEKSYDQLFLLMNSVVMNSTITKEDKMTLMAKLMDDGNIVKSYGKEMEITMMILEANYKDDDVIMMLRPEFLQKEGSSAEAALRLEEIIEQNPNNYFAWERLLLVYYELKDYKKLQVRGEECATKFNRSVIAKILYADGAMENKNFNTALEELRKADILAGDNKEMKLQVLTMKADVYYRMKDYSEAFKNFEEALKLNNNDLTVMNNYAYYLAEQNTKLKEAEKMAKEVIEKEKDNNTFLDTYAWVLYKRGRTRDALKIMERIITPDGKADSEYYEHYGYMLKKIGKCEDAVKQWEIALNLDKSKTNLQKEIENCGK